MNKGVNDHSSCLSVVIYLDNIQQGLSVIYMSCFLFVDLFLCFSARIDDKFSSSLSQKSNAFLGSSMEMLTIVTWRLRNGIDDSL